jgi:hypothetical protein
MLAGLRRFIDDRDRKRFAALLLLDLRETQCRGQPAGTTANDQYVYFECLALRH